MFELLFLELFFVDKKPFLIRHQILQIRIINNIVNIFQPLFIYMDSDQQLLNMYHFLLLQKSFENWFRAIDAEVFFEFIEFLEVG